MELPKGSIMVSNLLVVKYMDSAGEVHVKAEAYGGDSEDLSFSETLELLEWSRLYATAPYMAHAVAQFCMEDLEDE